MAGATVLPNRVARRVLPPTPRVLASKALGVAANGDLAAVDGGDYVGGLLLADPRGALFGAGGARGKLNYRHPTQSRCTTRPANLFRRLQGVDCLVWIAPP